MGAVNHKNLKWDLEMCEDFLLESEIENGRQRVFNVAMATVDSNFFGRNGMLCLTAELLLAIGIVLKIIKNGNCWYH